jgi:type II secretory ATPase GspE/PulE/Tfp pilus assembly ATPase PilB-like protein
MFDYINVVYWLVALLCLFGWARFATFVAQDVDERLNLPPVPWKLGYAGVLLVMFAVFVFVPNFWIALAANFVVVASAVGLFWWKRVELLGPSGHLFSKTLGSLSRASGRMEERKNARQVTLQYSFANGSAMTLPAADNPLAAGLATADQLIIQGLVRRAEGIDLIPTEGSYNLLYIVDGFPYHQPAIARTEAESAIQALKVLGGLNVEERRRPQNGKFRSKDAEGATTVWSVRTSGSTAGERLHLLANEKGQWDLRLDGLGMTTDQLAEVKTLIADTRGVVIVATPKGSGRTSTLYALLRQHDAFTNSIQTLETNAQAELEGVTFNTFDNRNAEVPYSKALSSIFLKDPNIVMTAQLPDPQTADAITRFASDNDRNGHRVYVGMAGQDTLSALDMWMANNTDKKAAIECLRAIISERLVRILCPTCKVPYQPDEAMLKKFNLPVGRNLQAFKANTGPIRDKKGNEIICPDCAGSGFKGRTGIFEVLMITDEIRSAVLAKSNHTQIRALARKQRFSMLADNGVRKFAGGIATEKNPSGQK